MPTRDAVFWTVEPRPSDGCTVVRFSGDITEASDFSSLLALDARSIALDLADVHRVNSSGVRQWIQFVSALAKRARETTLERCSVAIVHQLTMVSSFRGDAQVRSVYVPYACPSCGREDAELADVDALEAAIDAERTCPECGTAMSFDDLPEVYTALLPRA